MKKKKKNSNNCKFTNTQWSHNSLGWRIRNSHTSGVNNLLPLLWTPLGHWSGCVFSATWEKECAGSSIVSACLGVRRVVIYTLHVCQRKVNQSRVGVSVSLSRETDSGGRNILEVSRSRVISWIFTWTQRWMMHAYEHSVNAYEQNIN